MARVRRRVLQSMVTPSPCLHIGRPCSKTCTAGLSSQICPARTALTRDLRQRTGRSSWTCMSGKQKRLQRRWVGASGAKMARPSMGKQTQAKTQAAATTTREAVLGCVAMAVHFAVHSAGDLCSASRATRDRTLHRRLASSTHRNTHHDTQRIPPPLSPLCLLHSPQYTRRCSSSTRCWIPVSRSQRTRTRRWWPGSFRTRTTRYAFPCALSCIVLIAPRSHRACRAATCERTRLLLPPRIAHCAPMHTR